jgi:TrmH family RNA methyltransferase
MAAIKIESKDNPKIKQLIKLQNKRTRDKTGFFIIEGYREILRALDAQIEIEFLLFSPSFFLGTNENALISRVDQKKVFEVEKEIFAKISYRDRPDGLIAVGKKWQTPIEDLEEILKKKKNPFLLVCESIEKPGNLGTILRSSDAAGVDAVVVLDPLCDLFNPNVVRSSIGTLFTQKIFEMDTNRLFSLLKKYQVQILAATPHAQEVFFDVSLKGPIALLMGTEQLGLTEFWMKNCDIQVKIPMLGKADSLNVATATTLLLYEVVRQRRL